MTTVSQEPAALLVVDKEQQELTDIIEKLLAAAKAKGATATEITASVDAGFSVNVRMGEVDTLEYERDKGVAITVYFGQSKGSASSSDLSKEAVLASLDKACSFAKFAAADADAGLADPDLMAYGYPDLDLYYPWAVDPEAAIEMAKLCEAKGLAFDKRIQNSDGANISTGSGLTAYGNSHGFIGVFPSSRHMLSLMLLAKAGENMQRSYYYTTARDPLDLESPQHVALRAAEKTIARLNGQRLKTQKVPMIFEREVARGFLGHLVSAISGGNLYRNASFLLNHLGQAVFPEAFNVCERPHLKKGLGSCPFDAEGVATKARDIVAAGQLRSYILSSYSARKLGMQTTGNAGGVHNLTINDSGVSFEGLLKKMDKGILVTELMGQGVNIVTGDYSRGCSGFWVENGEIQYPVEEITIAGNLKKMFSGIVAVANDLDVRGSIHSGSILIDEVTIAGV